MKISAYKQSFGKAAKDYQKYRDSYDKKAFKLLFSLTEDLKHKPINLIDIGCGTGKSTEPLFNVRKNKNNISVVGLDPDINMLHEAKLHAKKIRLPIKYIKASAEKIPFDKGTFDAAISGTAFHWFGTKKAMNEIKRILKPEAPFLVVWTQYVNTDKETIGAGIFKKYKFSGIPKKFRDTEKVKNILQEAGFHNVKTVKIPYIEKKTLEESIGILKTGGTFTLLSPKQQKDFIKEMTRAYKEALRGKKYDVNKKETRICYGFK